MSTMAENIVKALSDEGLLKHDFTRRRAVEIVSDILGLEIEDITITDFEIPREYVRDLDLHELEHKPFRLWTQEDHKRFQESFNWQPCDNLAVFKDAEE